MGRDTPLDEYEDPIDSSVSTFEEQLLAPFRQELRALNTQNKTVGALSSAAKRFGRKPNSSSTMHNVLQCVRLPTADAIAAYVAAVTDDDEHQTRRFVGRRDEIAAAFAAINPKPTSSSAQGKLFWSNRRVAALSAALIVITAAVTATVTKAWVSSERSDPGQSVLPMPTTGDDPQLVGCTADAVRANVPQLTEAMTVLVLFSPSCDAVWGKVERSDGAGSGDTITVITYRPGDTSGDDTQRVDETDVGNAYSPLIVRDEQSSPICVAASMTVDNGERTVTASEPLCT